MTQTDPLQGAKSTAEGLTLPEIWQQLHSNAAEWRDMPRNSRFYDLRDMIDQSDRQVLRQLSKTPERNWIDLCTGAGWTGLGAVALTWCADGSKITRVASAWEKTGIVIHPDDLTLRALNLSNSKTIPRMKSLLEILTLAKGNHTISALMIAASFDDLEVDVEEKYLANTPDPLKPLLYALTGNSMLWDEEPDDENQVTEKDNSSEAS